MTTHSLADGAGMVFDDEAVEAGTQAFLRTDDTLLSDQIEAALNAALASLRERGKLRAGMGWQPIETAPKGGTWVLLTGGTIDYGWDGGEPPTMVVGQALVHHKEGHTFYQFAWYDSGYYGEYENPTHWMPLPPPPTASPAPIEGE